MGDCNTWGITNPPIGNTILDKFCSQLTTNGNAIASQNIGFGMGCTREGVELVRRKAKPADVVLINFGLVDTWITSIPEIYVPYYPDTFMRKRCRKLLKFVKRCLRSPWLKKWIPRGPVVPIEEYDQNLRAMIARVRDTTPHATVLLWGSPPVQEDPERNANLDRYNQRLKQIAGATNSLYVSTDDLVNQLSKEAAYLDEVHLNEDATQAIAARLAIVYRKFQQLAVAG